MLKWKHQLKDSTNIAQLAIDNDDDKTSYSDDNNFDGDSHYVKFMEIIKTEI